MLVKFEQNRMVETIRNFKLFDWKKKTKQKQKQKHYWQSADAILKDIYELK